MSRDWKPGDVLLCNDEIVLVTGAGDQPNPYFETQSGGCLLLGEVPDTARPLAAIDPENREQVASLMGIYYRDINGQPVDASAELVDQMQAALREFANPTPPKPDEPTGWLARVADDKGDEYVRAYEHGYLPWVAVCHTDVNGAHLDHLTHRHWGEIAAVRVLSEGAQP